MPTIRFIIKNIPNTALSNIEGEIEVEANESDEQIQKTIVKALKTALGINLMSSGPERLLFKSIKVI